MPMVNEIFHELSSLSNFRPFVLAQSVKGIYILALSSLSPAS